MGTLITRDKRLEKVWLDFINGKSEQSTFQRQVIYDSWIRCRQYGIDPYLGRVPQALNGVELDEELKRKDDLLQVAVPVIEDLFAVVDGSGFGVWITNEKGVILKGIANKDDQELLEEYGMVEGSDFSEEAIGTNAIGTSIKLRQPVPVVWMEHYCQIAHITACSAAPIMSSEGEIVGVISMTGYQEKAHPHTLGIVVPGGFRAGKLAAGFRYYYHLNAGVKQWIAGCAVLIGTPRSLPGPFTATPLPQPCGRAQRGS